VHGNTRHVAMLLARGGRARGSAAVITGRKYDAEWEVGISAQGMAAGPPDPEMRRRGCAVEWRE